MSYSNFFDSSLNPCVAFYYHSLLLLEFNFVMLFLCLGFMGEKEKCNQFSLHKEKTLAEMDRRIKEKEVLQGNMG